MRAESAVLVLAFRATLRSHPLRAAWALAAAATFSAPFLVAFAFSGAESLAREGAVGTACLFAPAAALFAGVGLATGDRGGDGLAPILRGPVSPGFALGAASAGIAAATGLGTLAASAVAIAALAVGGAPAAPGHVLGPIASSLALAPAAAAVGLVLGIAAPRALAAALAALLAAGALAGPPAAAAGILPRADAFLLARDAAFGSLPAAAVLLAAASSLAFAAAATAAGAALLRVKDLAPRPAST